MLDKVIARLQTRFKMLDFTDNQIHDIIEKLAERNKSILTNDQSSFYDTYLEFENQFLIAIIKSGNEAIIMPIKREFEANNISYMERKYGEFSRLDYQEKRQIYSLAFQKVVESPLIDNFKFSLSNAMIHSYNDYKRQMNPEKKVTTVAPIKIVYTRTATNLYQIFSEYTKEEVHLVLKYFTRETRTLPLLKKAYGSNYQGLNCQVLTFEEINRLNNILKRFQEFLIFIHTLLQNGKTKAYIENLFATKEDVELLSYMKSIKKPREEVKKDLKPKVKKVPVKPIIPIKKTISVGYTLEEIYQKYKINESTLLKAIASDNNAQHIDAFKAYFGLQTAKMTLNELASKYQTEEKKVANWIVNIIIKIPTFLDEMPNVHKKGERSLFSFFDFTGCSETEEKQLREQIKDIVDKYYPQLKAFFGPSLNGWIDYKALKSIDKNHLLYYIRQIKKIITSGPKRKRKNIAYSFWSFWDIDKLPLEEQTAMKQKVLDHLGSQRSFMESLFGPSLEGTIVLANIDYSLKNNFFTRVRRIKQNLNNEQKEHKEHKKKIKRANLRTLWSLLNLSSYSDMELEQFKGKVRSYIELHNPELVTLFGDDLEASIDYNQFSTEEKKTMMHKLKHIKKAVTNGTSGRRRSDKKVVTFWQILALNKKLFQWQRREIINYLQKNASKEWTLWSDVFGPKLDQAINLNDLSESLKQEIITSIHRWKPMIDSRIYLRSLLTLADLDAYPAEQRSLLLEKIKKYIEENRHDIKKLFNGNLDGSVDYQQLTPKERSNLYIKLIKVKEDVINDVHPKRKSRLNHYNAWSFFDFSDLEDAEIEEQKEQIVKIIADNYASFFASIFGDNLNNCVDLASIPKDKRKELHNKVMAIKRKMNRASNANYQAIWSFFPFDDRDLNEQERVKDQIRAQIKLHDPEFMNYFGANLDRELDLQTLSLRERRQLVSKLKKYHKIMRGEKLRSNYCPYRTLWSFFKLEGYSDEELSNFKLRVRDYIKIYEPQLLEYFGDNLAGTVPFRTLSSNEKRNLHNCIKRICTHMQNEPLKADERTFFSFFDEDECKCGLPTEKQLISYATINYPEFITLFGPSLDKTIDFNKFNYCEKQRLLKQIKALRRELFKERLHSRDFLYDFLCNLNEGIGDYRRQNLTYLNEDHLVPLFKDEEINPDLISDIVAILKVENACDNWSLGYQILLYKLYFPQAKMTANYHKILMEYLKAIRNFAENKTTFKRIEKYSNLLTYFGEFAMSLTEKGRILDQLRGYLYEMNIFHNTSPMLHLLTRLLYTDESIALTDDERQMVIAFYHYEWPIIRDRNYRYSHLLNYSNEVLFANKEDTTIYKMTKRNIAITDIARKTGYSLATIIQNYLHNLDVYNIHALSYLIIYKYPVFIPDLLMSDYYRSLMADLSEMEKYLIYFKLRAIADPTVTYEDIAAYLGITLDDVINYHIYSKDDKAYSLNLLWK